jgi:hypothetical protein
MKTFSSIKAIKSNKVSIIISNNQGFLIAMMPPGITPINHRGHFAEILWILALRAVSRFEIHL